MKKTIRIMMSILIIFSIFLLNTTCALAKSSEDYKRMWIEKCSYPMNMREIEMNRLSLVEAVDVLNPPDNLLRLLSTEELAELLLDYPLLWMVISYDYTEREYFWDFMGNFNIYSELIERDDGIDCLIDRYFNNDFDVLKYNDNPHLLISKDEDLMKEIFCCQFFSRIYQSSANNNNEFYEEVFESKKKLYSSIEDANIRNHLSFEIVSDDIFGIEKEVGVSDGSKDLLRSFNSWGYNIQKSIEGQACLFTVGTYSKYGANPYCLRWFSGVYDASTQSSLDGSLWTSWNIVAPASPKYNCHSYAWIWPDSSNNYWMDSPTDYMGSSVVTYKGYNITPSVGDIIVMYRTADNHISHSAIVIATPPGATGIYTISKFGGKPLAEAPLSDVQMFYQSGNYAVYSTN